MRYYPLNKPATKDSRSRYFVIAAVLDADVVVALVPRKAAYGSSHCGRRTWAGFET